MGAHTPMTDKPPDFRRLFESAPGLYLVLTPDLRIVAASGAYLDATMTRRENVIGRPLFEVFPDNPADPGSTGVANLAASLGRVLRDRAPDAMPVQKYDIRRPAGNGGAFEERYWSPVNSPVFGANGEVEFIIHAVEDVTELRRVLEAVPEAIIEADAAGRIDLVNDSAVKMFGYTREELLELNIDELVPEAQREAHAGYRSEYVRHPRIRPMGQGIELSGRRKDGSTFPAEISLSPNVFAGRFRTIASVRDITERRRAEAQIERHRAQLLFSARLSTLGLMAGGIAHEIGNPLAIIHASASDLLSALKDESSLPPEVVRRNAERIRQTANRIANIVRSMRALAREGSQDVFRPTRVARIVDDALEICRDSFRMGSVDLRLPEIDPALSIPCREGQIAQVLLNLLQNAYDAATDGPGPKWVRLGVEAADSSVLFSVTDSGPGIPPHVRSRLMEPFFTTKEPGKGTGLGLSISRTVIEGHGGELGFTEKDGHSCFYFRLPRLERTG
ncbi:MAG TPA: PAS domain S-box protein [Bryobacteraceae bacterium]|nr:PAS domain S-box protein [Bryobacteraceae bacterium]